MRTANPLSFACLVFVLVVATSGMATWAVVLPDRDGRFDGLVVHDPSSGLGRIAERPADLPGYDAEREGWNAFGVKAGGRWNVHIDRRSGAPMLVSGRGIPWVPAGRPQPTTPTELESLARELVSGNELLFKIREAELVLDAAGSGRTDDEHWKLVFTRRVNGIPVEGQRFLVYVNYGNLVAFGADSWGKIESVPEPLYGEHAARSVLFSYMGLTASDTTVEPVLPELVLIAAPPAGEQNRRHTGAVGAGVRHLLVWTFAVRVAGEPGTWVGKIDAVTGDVVAFYDDDKYAQVKGSVYPETNDGNCPEGCSQPDYPMPWSDVSVDGNPQTTTDTGLFDCSTIGATATTTLNGQFIRINDRCGAISESVTCEDDLDLGTSGGTDCTVPAGASAGNTHSARSCFYHANRAKEKGRSWLPGNTWLNQKLTCDVNITATCNATWNGEINFYKSGGGCGNTGEIAGVVHHEYGHGQDANDGGGFDNPSEAYADVVSILTERQSCIGPGFRPGQNCGGYGDTCLNCTGVRDKDWDQRQAHTPATPANFIDPNCGGGGGPCGRQVHCESYPVSEAIYDLAVRDLPASGMDPDSAWQLAEKLWYQSRQGSGGDTYNCSLPNSDGCGAGNWFQEMRVADDDDGNLANGTPHAAALFAAFDRHGVACGLATDPENQDSSSCPSLTAPTLTGTAGSNAASLSWTSVANAADYLILRTDVACSGYSQNVIETVPAPTTDYVDDDLANDFPMHFRVQARAANQACDSPVSNCVSVTPQPFAGTVRLDRSIYNCNATINVSVRDANVGGTSVDVTIFSDTETTPETVTLTETSPGSSRFEGSIQGTSGASSNGDGLLALTHSDTITAEYVDSDDGMGGSNLTRQTTATSDCQGPVISSVEETGVTDVAATITWATDEASSSVVRWGSTIPPQNVDSTAGLTVNHSVGLSGLQQCTVYYYSVESQDDPGNLTVDDRFGAYHSFETLGDFGQGLQPCHDGQMTVQSPIVSCNDSFSVQVIDIDLNFDSNFVDTVDVTITSTSEPDPETITLTETGPDTSTFTGAIATGPAPAVPGDGILQTAHDDVLTATYRDADNGTGQGDEAFDTGVADCSGTGFLSVEVIDIGDDTATVRFTTSELTTGSVDWGTTPGLGNTVASTSLQTVHLVTLAPLDECGRLYFRVHATDQFGNTAVSDSDGNPYEFNSYEIPGALFRDGFESSTGWTLQGEWEIGAAQGLGSSPGDPASAFAGATVLGHDLSGQGFEPGNYEKSITEFATSPVIDGSALVNGELKFRRWLNVGAGGIAEVQVLQGGAWSSVWSSNSATGQSESSWSLQTLDISQFADGNAGLQVRFKQFGGFPASQSGAGWNVDRFIVRDGNQPAFAECGGCAGAPTFAGVSTWVDDDPCSDSGISLSWEIAPGWGTGGGGTYAVYRDTTAGFTPGPANLVASGIAGTSFTDTTAPNDVDLYYVVRAENDETCGVGPNNGGVTDPNLVYATVRDDTSQPLPADVGDGLRVRNVNDAHVRLSWPATPNAASYHVLRADSAEGPFGQVADVGQTLFEDQDEVSVPTARYYLVRGADACGNEGP